MPHVPGSRDFSPQAVARKSLGIGGLGHMALQYVKIFGGTVAAIDVTDEKLQLAKELGAGLVIDARSEARRWCSKRTAVPTWRSGWPPATSPRGRLRRLNGRSVAYDHGVTCRDAQV